MDLERFSFRPFGSQKGDLDIDFDSPRPGLVSDVLRACLAPKTAHSHAALEKLPVGERLALLIELVRASGDEFLRINLACDAVDCRQTLETELDLSALQDMHRQASQTEQAQVSVQGASIILRRPTALDQSLWRQSHFENPRQALEHMMETLVVESELELVPPISEAIVEAVEKAMRSADPLVALGVSIECPDCGRWQERPLDLGWMLLSRLRRIQTDLIEIIHQLAKSYHWTEEQILTLPARRQAQYLRLIRSEG
jgi:hypothetical protein